MTEIQKQQIQDLRLKGLGYKAIAAVLGISRDTVRGYCKRNGFAGNVTVIALKTEEKKEQNLLCPCCSKPIKQPKRGRARRFCSDECRRKWWNDNPQERKKRDTAIYKYTCPYCGKSFSCYGNKKRKYCSHHCYIKDRFWREEDGV